MEIDWILQKNPPPLFIGFCVIHIKYKLNTGRERKWPIAKFSLFHGQGHLFHYKCSSTKTNIISESFIILVSGNGLNQHVLVLDAAEPAVVPGCTVSMSAVQSMAEWEETW